MKVGSFAAVPMFILATIGIVLDLSGWLLVAFGGVCLVLMWLADWMIARSRKAGCQARDHSTESSVIRQGHRSEVRD